MARTAAEPSPPEKAAPDLSLCVGRTRPLEDAREAPGALSGSIRAGAGTASCGLEITSTSGRRAAATCGPFTGEVAAPGAACGGSADARGSPRPNGSCVGARRIGLTLRPSRCTWLAAPERMVRGSQEDRTTLRPSRNLAEIGKPSHHARDLSAYCIRRFTGILRIAASVQ